MSKVGLPVTAITGLRPGLAADLASRGGFRTVDDVLAAYDLSIASACDLSINDARALDLLHRERADARVATPLPALNRALGGGLPSGITEVCARAGMGKTQFALSCVAAALQKPSRVLFVDSEGTFSPLRLREMLSMTLPPLGVEQALASVIVVRVHSTEEMLRALEAAAREDALLALLVVDSIAATARAEYASAARRADDLSSVAHVLKSISARWRCPALVTNQITANLSRTQHSAPASSTLGSDLPALAAYDEELMPALGNTWSHCVSTRLFMRPPSSTAVSTSCIEIVKSPMAALTSVPYLINAAGVQPSG